MSEFTGLELNRFFSSVMNRLDCLEEKMKLHDCRISSLDNIAFEICEVSNNSKVTTLEKRIERLEISLVTAENVIKSLQAQIERKSLRTDLQATETVEDEIYALSNCNKSSCDDWKYVKTFADVVRGFRVLENLYPNLDIRRVCESSLKITVACRSV